MAKKATKTTQAFDLFDVAVASKPKEKAKDGTIIKLPLDNAAFNAAIDDLHKASAKASEAEALKETAASVLKPWVLEQVVKIHANIGTFPETPIKVINSTDKQATYVVQNKSGQNPLSEEQIESLTNEFGQDTTNDMTEVRVLYSFNPDTMKQQAANGTTTVEQVVRELINSSILADDRLSMEQKKTLLKVTKTTHLRPSILEAVTNFIGKDVNKLLRFFEIAGSSFVRYFRAS